MNVTLNWVGFQLSQIKGTICKIRKEYIKNIPFQRKKQMNTLETNSSLLQSFSILEEKNREIHWRWSKSLTGDQ